MKSIKYSDDQTGGPTDLNLSVKICIDIANGYTQKFASFVSKVREVCPSNLIVAGNVATPEMVTEIRRRYCSRWRNALSWRYSKSILRQQ